MGQEVETGGRTGLGWGAGCSWQPFVLGLWTRLRVHARGTPASAALSPCDWGVFSLECPEAEAQRCLPVRTKTTRTLLSSTAV